MSKMAKLFVIILITLILQGARCGLFIPQIPKECEDQSICEDVPNYPYEYAHGVIKTLEKDGYIFGSSDVFLDSSQSSGENPEFNFIELCPSKNQSSIPLAAKDINDGKWRFVLNRRRNDGPQVIVYQMLCKDQSPNITCGANLEDHDLSLIPCLGYTLKCEQKFMRRKMITLDELGGIGITEIFAASCCACAAYQTC